jgi:hypothetical protein
MSLRLLVPFAIALLAVGAGCNRNMEPYVPGEEPKQPDLSRIFPEQPDEPGPAPMVGMPAAPGQQPAESTAQPIQGTIEVSHELADRVPSGATLFVIARMGEGGPPTAVLKVPSPSFPFAFSIGPEHRMIQTMPFSGPLKLTARLDSDGNAGTRTPGDLQGQYPEPVDPGAQSLKLTLDEVL